MQPPMKRVSGRLLEVLTIYSRALTEKSLVFMIRGRLWEVFANKRWLHMEVRLYL